MYVFFFLNTLTLNTNRNSSLGKASPSSHTMLTVKRSAGVALEVLLRNALHAGFVTVGGHTKKAGVPHFFKKQKCVEIMRVKCLNT